LPFLVPGSIVAGDGAAVLPRQTKEQANPGNTGHPGFSCLAVKPYASPLRNYILTLRAVEIET
jgi:hypothetical protein